MKYIQYLLLGLIIFLLYRMNKTMNMQTTLIMALASKMGLGVNGGNRHSNNEFIEAEVVSSTRNPAQASDQNANQNSNAAEGSTVEGEEMTEEEQARLIALMKQISDKITKGEKIKKKEREIYAMYFSDIIALDPELKLHPLPLKVTRKFDKDKNDDDKGNEKKDDNDGKPRTSSKRVGSAKGEKTKVLLDYLKDNGPADIATISKMFADRFNIKDNIGNTYTKLTNMEKNDMIIPFKTKLKGKDRVFYCLPEWYDENKKLKKVYVEKINGKKE